MTAQDIRTLRKVTIKLVETEERSHLLRSLVAKRIGFKEVEEFVGREKSKLKGSKSFEDSRRLVKMAMGEKLKDNLKFEEKLRRHKAKLKTRLGKAFETTSRPYRGILKKINEAAKRVREKTRVRVKKKESFLSKKYGVGRQTMVGLADLAKVGQLRFSRRGLNGPKN